MKANREAMKAYPENMEANPEEMKFVAVHDEVPKEKAAVETVRALKKQYGDWHRVPPIAEETDPRQWWVLEEIGCCLQRDDLPYRSGMA
jgi:hypothetical protein